MTAPPFASLPLLLATGLVLAGCSAAPQPTLYLLQASAPSASAPAGKQQTAKQQTANQRTVALGPLTIPDYLDRTEFVRRASDHRLALADNERWAEPLRAGLLRVLVAELSQRLGNGWWVATDAGRNGSADVELPVSIESFEADAAGRVTLTASWELRQAGDDHRPIRRRTSYSRTLTAGGEGAGAEAQVRALSANLTDFAADLAAALAEARHGG